MELYVLYLVWSTLMEGCDIYVGTPLEFGTFLSLGFVKHGLNLHCGINSKIQNCSNLLRLGFT